MRGSHGSACFRRRGLAASDGLRSRGTRFRGYPTAAALGVALAFGATARASAASYDFLAAPETDLNRVYRLDKATGEVGACQYGLPAATAGGAGAAKADIGVTLCYPPGEGAGAQSQSEYGLIASRHDREGGVFRVDLRTGTMSICYVLNDAVVCTPPAK